MNDLQSQAAFVAGSAWRLLAQIDRDALSPTHGCAHLAYWRDKTSDVSDSRLQESMLPLAMLYTGDYPGSSLRGDENLLEAAQALLGFWRRNQYPDGSLDEWYKGERAFAAAAFGTFAVSRTLMALDGHLPPKLVDSILDGLDRTGSWLCGRDDLFKTNHQAVGACALAYAGHVLGRPDFTTNAKLKIESVIASQTPEAWFPEVGRMDVGYTFLTVEYATMAMDLWGDFSRLEPFSRAYDFACRFVHPDLTLGEEYGICRNPYISRIATILLSGVNPLAAGLKERFEATSCGTSGLTPTLADDLRFPRWAFQPLAAWDYAQRAASLPAEAATPLPLAEPDDRMTIFPQAGQAFLSAGGKAVIASAAAGGMVRFFGPQGAELTEYGYCALDGVPATSQGYRPGAAPARDGDSIVMTSAISAVSKFMPSYWARVALRLACSTALGSRLARKGIDIIRRKKGTALNQSSPSLAEKSSCTLTRRVTPGDGCLILTDLLIFNAPVSTRSLFVLRGEGSQPASPEPLAIPGQALPETVRELVLTRTFRPDGRWHCVETSLG